MIFGDVSGKSVAGALMMMAAHEALYALAMTRPRPEELFALTNRRLYELGKRSFVALGYFAAGSDGRSPKALEEFDAGLKDLAKMYHVDAVQHFEKALELDPGFAMAKLHLANLYPSRSERKRLHKELRQIDPDGLKARERFLLTYRLARLEKRDADAGATLAKFLEQYPNDPFGLRVKCAVAWKTQAWDEAERCYHNLLALHPNRVEARNNLGHIALARGRFDEAEERLRTYRYLAPDQANPHHSLAVLATIRGRWEEAEKELEETVRIKPDFCAAYTQRVEVGLMSGRFDMATDALEDLEAITECGYLQDHGEVCAARAWMLYLGGDAEAAWRQLDGGCLERLHGFDLLAHRIAVMTDRVGKGIAMEQMVSAHRDKMLAVGRPVHARDVGALLAHMRGIRELAAGDLKTAVEHLSEADDALYYWGGERGNIKLFNRLNLLRTLELAGHTHRAVALRREIDGVNPRLVDAFPLPDVDALHRVGSDGPAFPLREDQHQ